MKVHVESIFDCSASKIWNELLNSSNHGVRLDRYYPFLSYGTVQWLVNYFQASLTPLVAVGLLIFGPNDILIVVGQDGLFSVNLCSRSMLNTLQCSGI